MTNATLLQKLEELGTRVVTVEAENTRLQRQNQLLRQKLEHYIQNHYCPVKVNMPKMSAL